MPHNYPRVAIVSTYPFSPNLAVGIAMRSLFLGWDRRKLTQIYAPFLRSEAPDYEVCDDIRRLCWNGRVVRQLPEASNRSSLSHRLVRPRIAGLINSHLFQKLGTPFRNWWLGRARFAQGLQRELEVVRPDVVYAYLNSMPIAKAATIACANLDIPLCIHVGDDFPRAYGKDKNRPTRQQALAEYWLKRTVEYASGKLAIGPHMAREYSDRYGGDWTWFTTLVETDAYDPTPRPRPSGTPIRMVYTGNLTFNRWESLRLLGSVLKKLYNEGIPSELVIYASSSQLELYREQLDIRPVVTLRSWVPPEQLPRIYQEADILVHCESFSNSEISENIKLSFSTKISQYMMAGRCILALGPSLLASMKFIKEKQAGIIVETQDAEVLMQCLRTALKDRNRLDVIGRGGRKKAMECFEGISQRERFYRVLNDAIRVHESKIKSR